MNKQSEDLVSATRPSREQISLRAELLWKAQGSPSGRDDEIWLEAERQLVDEAREVIAPVEEFATKTTQAVGSRPRPASPEQMIEKKSAPANSKRRSSASR